MKVVYSNGKIENLEGEETKKLYVRGRLSKESWQELLYKMKELDIVKFEDEMLKEYGVDMVSIEYVKNQVSHLSF